MDKYSLNNNRISILMLLSLLPFLAGCMMDPGPPVKTGCIYGNCQEGVGIKRDRRGLYVGQWAHGKLHGKGTWRGNSLDRRYYGNWKMGKKHGMGTMFFEKGTISGKWRKGRSGIEMIYIGNDGKFSGLLMSDKGFHQPYLFPAEGELIWSSGDKYRGTFGCIGQVLCGVPQGNGEFVNNKGKILKGNFNTRLKKHSILFGLVIDGTVISADGTRKYTLDIMERGSPITFKFGEISEPKLTKK